MIAYWIDWLCGERDQYVEHWSAARAEKAYRATLRMWGRGETVYVWSAKIRALHTRSHLRRFEARKSA